MQDANTQAWTGSSARADEVAAYSWQAPVPFETVAGNKTGPAPLTVRARVNHGRWIVDCPDCAGAQFACPDDHRFMCNYCANVLADGLYRPVEWPKDRAKIEEVLFARPMPMNRNWHPGETVANLRAENKEHGVI